MLLPTSALPPALLELTLLRVSTSASLSRLPKLPANHIQRRTFSRLVRELHAEAAPTPPPPPPFHHVFGQNQHLLSIQNEQSNGTLQTGPEQMGPLSELEKRVQALEEAAVIESSALEPPSYSEEDLMTLYEDLLAIPAERSEPDAEPDPQAQKIAQAEQDLSVINAVEQRLLGSFPPPMDDSEEQLTTAESPSRREPVTKESDEPISQPYLRVLSHLQSIATRLQAVQDSIAPPTESASQHFIPFQQFFPISVISTKECEALIRVCLHAGDVSSAEQTLNLMKQAGVPLPVDGVTNVMCVYARVGNVVAIENAMTNYLSDVPTMQQRHLHIKAHLISTPLNTIPTTALQILHNYEAQSHPAPMQTYTSVITTLFSKPFSLARAQAWDLFSHMRYVAHPQPDVLLYTLMIRACASPISSARSSEPERALDLWTEMTVDHRMTPTVGAYSAVILACAKSGLKRYVNEAFRLAKEMLDSHRDARGRAAFRPDRRTFCALLEGAKRVGDLARARWILAEMVRGDVHTAEDGMQRDLDTSVNEEVMMHVFHAYAAYNPPFVRSVAPTVKGDSQTPAEGAEKQEMDNNSAASEVTLGGSSEDPGLPVTEDAYPSFTHIPPQSRQEVVHEVRALFHRILADTSPEPNKCDELDVDEAALPSERKFQNVVLTTRLLNSYISVFYRHSSFEESREMFWNIYDELGVARNARTYVEALERCGRSRKGRERQVASQFAEELWAKWEAIESLGQGEGGRPLSARLIERAHAALIRTLTLAGDLEQALNHLRLFVTKYPPQAVRHQITPKPVMRSTKAALVGVSRPLIRMTSSADVPDDNVPPFLTFRDVEALHHRLVACEGEGRGSAWWRQQQIGYVKWVCKAYEWALRVRREETLKAAAVLE
ncbi:hypothetical protein AX17_006173 [Amanita inopinata Kibby_2008]|nr:hypothetical protein AX17_006173 [Amanita inopinata Kibby_2008]